MSKPDLKLFRGDLSEDRRQRELDLVAGAAEPKMVCVSVDKIIPLLLDAAQSGRGWLEDFRDDTMRIDADLYEVLLAYQNLQIRGAA